VDLGIIHDPLSDPQTPYDPEGDGILYYFDFKNSSSEWIRSLKEDRGFWEYDEHFSLIKADVLGTHSIQVCAQDVRGADAGCKTATLNVVPPNPIPVITGGDGAVEGRPLPEPFSCASSFSPYKYRTISQCIWGGDKRDMYPTTGYYTVTLDVIDSGGLKNRPEDQASKTIYVKPDLPPVAQLTNPGLGIRGNPMVFKDTSYSPDNDPISEHWRTLTCDLNHNGSYEDDPVTNMNIDSYGNISFTPTQVGDCKISVHIREGIGLKKSDDKDFYFSVVNLQPEADFTAFGTQPEPPNIRSVVVSGNTLATSPAWSASSPTNSVNLKNYEYNQTDDSIETFWVNLIQPYKSITDRNVSMSWMRLERWYCPDCGNKGYLSGYYPTFNPNQRIDKRLWDSSNGNYGGSFYYEDNPAIPRSDTFESTPRISSYEEYWPSLFYEKTFKGANPQANIIWMRTYPTNNGSYFVWTDYFYRFSDLKTFTGGGYTGNYIMPYKTVTQSLSTICCREAPKPNEYEPPVPSDWVPYAGYKKFGRTIPVEFYRTIINDDGDKWIETSAGTVESPIVKDYAGNVYKNRCERYWWVFNGNYPSYCILDKYDPSETTLLWSSGPFEPGSNQYNIVNSYQIVEHISKNNSAILVSTNKAGIGNSKALLNNHNGSVIMEFNGYPAYNQNGLIFGGVYDDTLAYIYQTYTLESNIGTGTWTLYFYNMSTGVTTNAGVIKTYQRGSTTGYYDPDSYPSNSLATVVSSDGKLIIANNWSELLVYDMLTYQRTAVIPTGRKDPVNTSSDTVSSENKVKNIWLTEDGRVKVVYVYTWRDYDSNDEEHDEYELTVQTDVDNTSPAYSYGYLTNGDVIRDGEVSLQIKFNSYAYSDTSSAGIGFRSHDYRNMYRAEAAYNGVRLVKMVDGEKTILGSIPYQFDIGTYVNLKAKFKGNHITLYVNGVPFVDTYDDTFAQGQYGLYAEVPYVSLKGFAAAIYETNDVTVPNIAIIKQPITYGKSYQDPENDPAITDLSRWTFTHVEPYKFLDAGDGAYGISSYDGQTVTSPFLVFDKVGVYKVDYQIPDDPAPDAYKYPSPVFSSYRKYSDPATHSITVHRRPIAQFTVWSNADGTIGWNDTSYDPDRWLSSWNYSTEATGIDYAVTRGITERRYSYTSPSGATTFGKLTRPQESGIYTVRLAVKDEYGAWSDWAEQTIGVTMPVPNTPPNVELTFPSGSQANPSYVNTLRPTIAWNQWDADPDTTFAAYRVMIKDEWGNVVRDTGTKPQGTTATTAQWTLDFDLAIGQKYQVQVQVSDGTAWSAWSNIGWLVTNRPPQAAMTFPSGSQESPTVISQLRPTFQWSQTDPDPGTIFQYFELEVWNEANTERLLTSGQHWQGTGSTIGSWTASADLPPRQKLRVRVRVFDGFAWSDWSEERWLYINRAPIPDFDWSPKPIWEGDTVHLTNKSTDPDLDPLTSTWEIRTPSGEVGIYGMKDVISVFTAPGLYTVTLTVSDGLESRSVTRTLEAAPLTIRSDVRHTPEWRNIHQGKGHQIDVAPKDFYSGEVFVVETVSSPAPVAEAVAWIDAQGKSGKALYASATLTARADSAIVIEGELFDEMWMSETDGFPEGVMPVHFRIRYANGVVKTEDVPIRIIGNVYEAVNVHRRQ
jgi:hypothetical protein